MENIENKNKELNESNDIASNEQHTDHNEQQNIIEQFCKKIVVSDLPSHCLEEVKKAIAGLSCLREEIIQKKHSVIEKKNAIDTKISILKQSDKINIDEQEFKKSETSVHEYVDLLDKMIAEVDRDITFYQSIATGQGRPEYVLTMKTDPDGFEYYITSRISGIKKYIKTVKRDLIVSYSRYCYGFDAQIRQISFIEHVLNNTRSR